MTERQQLEVSRLIRAEPHAVFDAWTDPAAIVQWWGAGPIVCPEAHIDLRVGGTYRIANRSPDGNVAWLTGTFTDIDPPRSLRYTWMMEPPGPDPQPSIVHVVFTPEDGATRVTINHTRIASVGERDTNLFGWTGCLDRLTALLSR